MSSTAPGAEVARDFKPEEVIESLRAHLNPFLSNGLNISDGGIAYVVNELRADGYFSVTRTTTAVSGQDTINQVPCNQHYLGLVLDRWATITVGSKESGMTKEPQL
jgi:hypothetical protein